MKSINITCGVVNFSASRLISCEICRKSERNLMENNSSAWRLFFFRRLKPIFVAFFAQVWLEKLLEWNFFFRANISDGKKLVCVVVLNAFRHRMLPASQYKKKRTFPSLSSPRKRWKALAGVGVGRKNGKLNIIEIVKIFLMLKVSLCASFEGKYFAPFLIFVDEIGKNPWRRENAQFMKFLHQLHQQKRENFSHAKC